MTRPVLLLVTQTLLVLASLACAVGIVAVRPLRLDLTPDRRFTLSPHTHEVLDRIAGPVEVTVFYSSQDPGIRRDMTDLLALYTDASPHVRARFLDLDRSPGAAERLGVSSYNTAVLEAAGRREFVHVLNEDTVTAGLLRLTGLPAVMTHFVLGHGETDPRDADTPAGVGRAAAALAADGFVVRAIDGAAALPDDAALVVLAGPTRDLTPAEVAALADHVRSGGHLLALVDPPAPTSVARLLASFGVELANDVVVDDRARLFGADGLSARVGWLNEALVPRKPAADALLPVAQTLRLTDVPGVHGDYLAVTSESTWADVDRHVLAGGGGGFRDGTDRRGPLPVGALARVATATGGEGRVVAIGDADFATNRHLDVLGNRDLVVLLAGLAARADALGAARPRSPVAGLGGLVLTAREARRIFVATTVVPPLLLAGVAAAMARRRRRA